MKNVLYQYKVLCKESQYVWGLILGFSLLILSFIVANKAGEYASQVAGHSVDDLILSYLPLVNVTFLHVYAAILFWVCFIIYMFTRPQIIPFVTKTSALFIFVRSMFICLTHLGAPVNQLSIPENVTSYFLFDGDLFFSGHVGGPFLLMLLFWNDKKLRFLCLFFSLFFAYIVLIGHIHYSIDVFAAPFITYGVYALACTLFTKDYHLFFMEINNH